MSIIGGLIGLVGGAIGRRDEKKAIAAQNAYNDPSAVRARYEKAGINPLLAFNAGPVGLQSATGGTNYMGSAIADFAQSLSASITERQLRKADNANQAQQRNAKSDQKMTRMALRPKVQGPLEMARAAGGGASALGLTQPNTGSKVPVLPATGLSLPLSRSGYMGAVETAAPTVEDLAASPAASDYSKAVPKVPIFWDGYWQTPHPDFPDATLVEDYLGDEGPPSFIANTQSGMKKLGYGFAQTPLGMKIKGWTDGSYIAATRRVATDKYTKRKYGTDFRDMVMGPNGYLVPK